MGSALAACNLEGEHAPVPGRRFVDTTFPPAMSSFGEPKPGRFFISAEQQASVRWIRLSDNIRMNGCIAEEDRFGEPHIVWDCVQPTDVEQGALGNCWLVSVISSLAEHPEVVRCLFIEANPGRGRYVLRLFDMPSASWQAVEVDDFVPCTHEEDWSGIPHHVNEDGQPVYRYEDVHDKHGNKTVPKRWVPVFARPTANCVWAPVLEKALAKFVGSYAALAGGSEPYAFMTCTGFPQVYCFLRPTISRTSQCAVTAVAESSMFFANVLGLAVAGLRAVGLQEEPTVVFSDSVCACSSMDDSQEEEAMLGSWSWQGAEFIGRSFTGPGSKPVPGVHSNLGNDNLWCKLLKYRERGCLMTASITRFRQPETMLNYFRPDGLVLGHAYSCLGLVSVAVNRGDKPLCLVKLRNPHGGMRRRQLGIATHLAGMGTVREQVLGEWNGHWSEHSPLWERHPEVIAQVGVTAKGQGVFWMSFDDFCGSFDKVCVLPKPMCETIAETTSSVVDGKEVPMCVSLATMSDRSTMQALRQISLTFDPFLNLPDFLNDGSLEVRLCWEATKPGRLQQLLDANKRPDSTDQGRDTWSMLIRKVAELKLEPALGPDGYCNICPPGAKSQAIVEFR